MGHSARLHPAGILRHAHFHPGARRRLRRPRALVPSRHGAGDAVNVTLIDRSDAFVFGFEKLDMTFGRRTPESIRLPYAAIANGIRFRRETVTAIDPLARRVTTDAGTHAADILVVALGADYDRRRPPAWPGRQRVLLDRGRDGRPRDPPTFRSGRVLVGICGTPTSARPRPARQPSSSTITCAPWGSAMPSTSRSSARSASLSRPRPRCRPRSSPGSRNVASSSSPAARWTP